MRSFFSGKKAFLWLCFSALPGACASWQEGWTAEYQSQFKEACLSGDGRLHPDPAAYCECALKKTMQRYPTIASFMEMKDTAQHRAVLRSCP